MEKVCTVCGATKTLQWYTGPTCKRCYRKQRYQDNLERERAHSHSVRARYRVKNKDKNPYDGTDKRCSLCRETLPRTLVIWGNSPVKFDGLQNRCRDCDSIRSLKYWTKKRGEIIDFPTPFTGKEARALKLKQNYNCYVCGKKEDVEKLHLDHDHNTGRIRGYACRGCNARVLAGLDILYKIDPTIINHPTIRRIFCDLPAKYLYPKT